MDGVKLISNISIPIAIVLFVIIYIVSVRHAGGLERPCNISQQKLLTQ